MKTITMPLHDYNTEIYDAKREGMRLMFEALTNEILTEDYDDAHRKFERVAKKLKIKPTKLYEIF
jgi:hypothetical protein